jgi:hypothetical protein
MGTAQANVLRWTTKTEALEGNMNEKGGGRRPSRGLLLLLPVAVILAKGAMHRRAMMESAWGTSGAVGGGYGHHRRFGGGEGEPDERRASRLPPRIESMLDAWHTRAHQPAESTEPPTI